MATIEGRISASLAVFLAVASISCGGGAEDPGLLLGKLEILPSDASLRVSEILHLSVRAWDRNGAPYTEPLPIEWESSDDGVATFASSGQLMGMGVGRVEVSARALGATARASFQVYRPKAQSLSLTPSEITEFVETPIAIVAELLDDEGQPVSERVEWTFTEPLSPLFGGGTHEIHLWGQAQGTATVGARYRNFEATATVHLRACATDILADVPEAVYKGETIDLRPTVVKEVGAKCSDTVHWRSSDPTVVRIEENVLTAIREGSAVVTARAGGFERSWNVEVSFGSLSVEGPYDAFIGDRHPLSATVYRSDGQTHEVQVEWTSSNPFVATVTGDGELEGHAPGWVVITARRGDLVTLLHVRVRPLPVEIHILTPIDELHLGEQVHWYVQVVDGDGEPVWSILPHLVSSRPDVVSVQDIGFNDSVGLLTAFDEGEAVIRAEYREHFAENSITVKRRRFTQVATGAGFLCALETSGQVFCQLDVPGGSWLGRYEWRLVPIEAPVPLTTLSLGSDHACGLTAAGEAYCFGNNLSGQLGVDSYEGSRSFVPVSTDLLFTEIHAGSNYTCGIAKNDTGPNAYCWGKGDFGQLGHGWFEETLTPAEIPIRRFSSLAVSKSDLRGTSTCGIEETGEAFCWGSNSRGQLGNGSTFDTPFPTKVLSPEPLVELSISANEYSGVGAAPWGGFACGLATSGSLYCWGNNWGGQTGLGLDELEYHLPTFVSGGWIRVSVIQRQDVGNVCALDLEGAAYCWGTNDAGQLGIGKGGPPSIVPLPVAGNLLFRNIDVGLDLACGMTIDDLAYCWGRLSSLTPAPALLVGQQKP